ncbi:hypothetical protein B9Z19DRAFT_1091130 [Tuber borchii]|uniref:Adhesin n=1 Tax=Tuber borchii TaxID=42251 RepID=A0A2T6ZHW5_TUBBO|nr:hypothetical protein B9Z19DRAFT_1091130 [Tuber borchii]
MKSIFGVVFTLLSFLLLASGTPTPDRTPVGYCEQCDPHPPNNKCDITTSCINTLPSYQLHCACRAGYKSSSSDPNDQYLLPFAGQGYRVFVRPGVVCNTLCDNWQDSSIACKEVTLRPECDPSP